MMAESDRVRLRLGDGRFITVPAYRPGPAAGARPITPPAPFIAAPSAAVPEAAPPPRIAGVPLSHSDAGAGATTVVVALIEAVPAGAEEMAATMAGCLMRTGLRVGLMGLEQQNRLARRLEAGRSSQGWQWKAESADLFIRQGACVIVPGPSVESELSSSDVSQVLRRLMREVDTVVVDLGCRWEPRLFRPVLAQATHIWVLTRPGQWSGAEMRLEQAEFSGWIDMGRVRVVVIGGEGSPPGALGAPVAAVLPDAAGPAAVDFVGREIGRVYR